MHSSRKGSKITFYVAAIICCTAMTSMDMKYECREFCRKVKVLFLNIFHWKFYSTSPEILFLWILLRIIKWIRIGEVIMIKFCTKTYWSNFPRMIHQIRWIIPRIRLILPQNWSIFIKFKFDLLYFEFEELYSEKLDQQVFSKNFFSKRTN